MSTIHRKEYLNKLPESIPPGRVLVHNLPNDGRSRQKANPNYVYPLHRRGGFRMWLQSPDDELIEQCDCHLVSKMGEHYRVKSE
jgi:hypothetical protein